MVFLNIHYTNLIQNLLHIRFIINDIITIVNIVHCGVFSDNELIQ